LGFASQPIEDERECGRGRRERTAGIVVMANTGKEYRM
jgi:phage terminase large subunit-like protein